VTEFNRLQQETFSEGKTMESTFEKSGRIKEKRDIVRKLVEKKFPPLPPAVVQKLDTLSAERLDDIILAILTAQSLKELGLADEEPAK
jgi:hypothetical protein